MELRNKGKHQSCFKQIPVCKVNSDFSVWFAISLSLCELTAQDMMMATGPSMANSDGG